MVTNNGYNGILFIRNEQYQTFESHDLILSLANNMWFIFDHDFVVLFTIKQRVANDHTKNRLCERSSNNDIILSIGT